MPTITPALVDDSTATIIAAKALGYLKANTVLAQLCARDWDTDVATHGQVVKIPFRGALSANDKTAGSAVTLQAPADTAVSVTLNKHKEVSFLIEDTARAFERPDNLMGYMSDGLQVLAEAIDGDLAALYATYTQTINATLGLAESDFREARRMLNAAKAPMGDRVAVLGEDAEKEALAIEKIVSTDYRGEDAATALREGFIGRFVGFMVYMDQKIASASSQIKNLFFHRNAMALVTRPLPPAPEGAGVVQVVLDEDGFGLRVTISYSADYLGIQVTIDVLYGVAVLRNNHGVVVSTVDV